MTCGVTPRASSESDRKASAGRAAASTGRRTSGATTTTGAGVRLLSVSPICSGLVGESGPDLENGRGLPGWGSHCPIAPLSSKLAQAWAGGGCGAPRSSVRSLHGDCLLGPAPLTTAQLVQSISGDAPRNRQADVRHGRRGMTEQVRKEPSAIRPVPRMMLSARGLGCVRGRAAMTTTRILAQGSTEETATCLARTVLGRRNTYPPHGWSR